MSDAIVLTGAVVGAFVLIVSVLLGCVYLARLVLEGAYMIRHRWMTLTDLREAVEEWRVNHPDKWAAYKQRSRREDGYDD